MGYPTTDADWVTYLTQRHDSELQALRGYDAYYEGEQQLAYMQPEILAEVGDRLQRVIINWPQLVVDSLEERLDVTGFRLPNAKKADDELWEMWQHNDLDEQAPQAHTDALALGRSYVTVGTREDESDKMPLITAESPLELFAEIDPRDRHVRAALRRIDEPATTLRESERTATLYLPDKTVWFDWTSEGWKQDRVDHHKLGEVAVVPLVNRPRLAQSTRTSTGQHRIRYGRSELAAVLSLSDAACKLATDMMVASEHVALPQRGFLGVSPEDFRDKDGRKLSPIQVLLGKMLAIPGKGGKEVKSFEFATADLSKFIAAINALAHVVAALAGLPPQYLGYASDQPASADAIRSAESRLIKRAERRQVMFGGSWERVMRLGRRIQDPTSGALEEMRRLETMWRNAATPTVAQAADRALKLYAAPAGQTPIVPLRQTREDLGYTSVQIGRMEEEDQKAREQDPVAALGRQLGMNTATGGDEDGRDPARVGDGAPPTDEAEGGEPRGADRGRAPVAAGR